MIRTPVARFLRCSLWSLQPSSVALRASSTNAESNDVEWRKVQLDRLRKSFEQRDGPVIEKDDDLQPMWKDMESRVVRRKSLTIDQAGRRIGRKNIRPTDEESWLNAGMYNVVESEEANDDELNVHPTVRAKVSKSSYLSPWKGLKSQARSTPRDFGTR